MLSCTTLIMSIKISSTITTNKKHINKQNPELWGGGEGGDTSQVWNIIKLFVECSWYGFVGESVEVTLHYSEKYWYWCLNWL